MGKTAMNALRVDNCIQRLSRSAFSCANLDEASQNLLRELFEITDALKPVGDDDLKIFWISVKRPTIRQFRAYYAGEEDISDDELRREYERAFPRAKNWYKVRLIRHANFEGEYFGAFLNGEYVLAMNDPISQGWPLDATELIGWLIEQAADVVKRVKAGTYNEEIARELPKEYRYGKIRRKDYWDIYPEEREAYRGTFTQQEIDDLLALSSELNEDHPWDWIPDNAWSSMTARQYYEACGVVFKALGLTSKVEKWQYADSEDEIGRYEDPTPKEQYYMFADRRDDGLRNVPMDDPEELEKWLDGKGEYYDFNGGHPWEIRPSFSSSFSMYLGIHYREKYYLWLSGEKLGRSIETLHAYLALRKAGYPVKLMNGTGMLARLTETDYIEILPEFCITLFGGSDSDMLDTVNLSDGDKPERVCEKAVWEPEKTIELKENKE